MAKGHDGNWYNELANRLEEAEKKCAAMPCGS
jgi:hypothetical protein